MSVEDDFRIRIESSSINKNTLHCKAYLEYIGENKTLLEYIEGLRQHYEPIIAYVNIRFDSDTMTYRGAGYDINYTRRGTKKIKLPFFMYNGFLNQFYNYASGYDLYKKFPVLQKTKGISYVLLMCCICEALKLGFITPESILMLEASGSIEGESMLKLIKYYEKIGFSVMYPEYLDIGVQDQFVPMKAQVKTIVDLCNVETVSPDMMKLLPVQMCKGICRSN